MQSDTPPFDGFSRPVVLLTFFAFYLAAVVVVALIIGSPGLLLLMPVLLPAGLLYNEYFEFLGMLAGYIIYIALFIAMLKYRSRREIYFALVGVLVLVLILNIRGCVAVSFYPPP